MVTVSLSVRAVGYRSFSRTEEAEKYLSAE
jgi:hypothetical protein